jgi:hypothetical protein
LHRCRGGAAQLSTILETAFLWRLQLYLNVCRKIVADFSTRKNRKGWGENRRVAKSGLETYSSAAPNRKHLHAGQPVFLTPFEYPASGRRFETPPFGCVCRTGTSVCNSRPLESLRLVRWKYTSTTSYRKRGASDERGACGVLQLSRRREFIFGVTDVRTPPKR